MKRQVGLPHFDSASWNHPTLWSPAVVDCTLLECSCCCSFFACQRRAWPAPPAQGDNSERKLPIRFRQGVPLSAPHRGQFAFLVFIENGFKAAEESEMVVAQDLLRWPETLRKWLVFRSRSARAFLAEVHATTRRSRVGKCHFDNATPSNRWRAPRHRVVPVGRS